MKEGAERGKWGEIKNVDIDGSGTRLGDGAERRTEAKVPFIIRSDTERKERRRRKMYKPIYIYIYIRPFPFFNPSFLSSFTCMHACIDDCMCMDRQTYVFMYMHGCSNILVLLRTFRPY
jgi:hypothetical protein